MGLWAWGNLEVLHLMLFRLLVCAQALLLLVSPGLAYASQEVQVCTGEYAYAYHSHGDCPGLNACSEDVLSTSEFEAIQEFQRKPCCLCWAGPLECKHDRIVAIPVARSGAESIVLLILAVWRVGNEIRDFRRAYRRGRVVGGATGGTAEQVFTCDAGYRGPAALGWCNQGSFVGPVYIGALGATISDEDVVTLAQAGLGYNLTARDFYAGFQLSVGANFVVNNLYGLGQLGSFNVVGNAFRGLLQAGLVNVAHDLVALTQSGLWNTAGEAVTLQVGAYNQADFLAGTQVGGFFNFGQEVYGLSVASLVNVHNVMGGARASTVNIALEHLYGLDLGVYNQADALTGAQVGVVNVAKRVKGIQVGVFNWASQLQGVQVGAFNVHYEGGLSFMLGFNAGWAEFAN